MVRFLTFLSLSAGAAAFWLWVPLDQFQKITQPLIVALSIMAAGLLVRLNRGMPALDWKSLEANERKELTQKIVELTRDYLVVLSWQAVTLVVLLLLAIKELPNPALPVQPSLTTQITIALAGGLIGLCLARMARIVWRDHDIVRLQKKLIDDSADRESLEKAEKDALSKVAAIRASGLRSGQKPEITSWGE